MREIEASSPSALSDARRKLGDGTTEKALTNNDLANTTMAAPVRVPEMEPLRGCRSNRRSRMAVGLVDAQPLRRQGLAKLLSATDVVVIEAAGAAELLAASHGATPELALVCTGGADFGDRWVQTQLEILAQHAPALPLILLSDREGTDEVARAMLSGIRGYLPTSLDTRVALEVLRLVRAGGTFVPAQALLRSYQDKPVPHDAAGVDVGAEVEAGHSEGGPSSSNLSLTRRQIEVLKLVCHGKPNKVIAHDLRLEESTVKVHLRDIMRKLKTENRTQLALLAMRLFGSEVCEQPSGVTSTGTAASQSLAVHGSGTSKRTGSETPTK